MPEAVPVTYGDFLEIERILGAERRFRRISRAEIAASLSKIGEFKPGRVFIPGEVGFSYETNGVKLKVWTTCVREKVQECRRLCEESPSRKDEFKQFPVSRPPSTDSGWFVIESTDGNARYFGGTIRRTKNFVQNLTYVARVLRWKISHWQRCPECKAPMEIVQKNTGATFWSCFRKEAHAKKLSAFVGWDKDLPPEVLEAVKARRKKNNHSRKKSIAQGHVPRRAHTIRKSKWR